MNIDVDDDVRRFYPRLWDKQEKQNIPHWNGRQIRNAFQTAIALAHWDYHEEPENLRSGRPTLRAKHFRRVGQITAHFDDYISSMHGLESQDAYSVLAAREEIRIDSAPHDTKKIKQAPRSKRKASRRNSVLDISSDFDSDEESSYEDESREDVDEIETLKLKLKLAKLKQKEIRKS
jgi:hypothetical protein